MVASPSPLRVLTLSTLFPDKNRPVLGIFVERQTLGLAAHPNVDLQIIVPRGLPPGVFARLAKYRSVLAVPSEELWQGVPLLRPRFNHLPRYGARWDVAAMVHALKPVLTDLRRAFPFDVIDAEYFFPDGLAAVRLGTHFDVPVSIKARGSDIHIWGQRPDTAKQVLEAGQRAQGLLAVSNALKADMGALGMPTHRIKVHYTGVDLALFKPVERMAAKAVLGINGPLIVGVGGLILRKGHDLSIVALAQIPAATLVIIGAGPDEQMLRQCAAEHGVADRVRFMGSQSRMAVAQWLAAADIMCLPTVSEGLANVWVEALACGTPVVTSDVGGAREVIMSDIAGRLVPRDAKAIAEALQAIIANPPAQEEVRQFAMRFTWEANTAALYDHLQRLVTAHRSAKARQ